MEKKTLIAMALVFVVLYVSQMFIKKPDLQNTKLVQEIEDSIKKIKKEELSKKEINVPMIKEDFVNNADIKIENEIILENSKMKLCFSNKGAVLTKAILKDYLLENEEQVNLLKANTALYGIKLQAENGDISLDKQVFAYQVRGNSLIFYLQGKNSNIVEKIFTLKDDYVLDFDFKINNYKDIYSYYVDFSAGIDDTEEILANKDYNYGVISQIDNSIDEFKFSKIIKKKNLSEAGKIDWAAIRSNYFIIGIVPDKLLDSKKIEIFSSDNSPAMKLFMNNSRRNFEHNYALYLGPNIQSELRKVGNNFEKSGQRAWKFLNFLSEFFVKFLKWMHKYINNYGLIIIIFSFVLKLILYPFTHKMQESGQKMQKVQPLIAEIRQKYKKDPNKMNEELKRIYRENNVNPLGGCLPLLIQMPIFIALYPALKYSIDLRGAYFGLWLKDLSAPDPYLVLPILMGVFMFLQQWLMKPKKVDTKDKSAQAAAQSQKIMLYTMPVLMVVIFRNFPAGLVLYWTVFNVLSIAQQIYIKKTMK